MPVGSRRNEVRWNESLCASGPPTYGYLPGQRMVDTAIGFQGVADAGSMLGFPARCG